MLKKISSLQNSGIKELIKLKKARERKKQDLILIEGRHEISLALEAGIEINKLYLCEDFSSDNNFTVKISEDITELVSKEVFEKISNRENPDGYLALANTPKLELQNVRLSKNPLVVILEAVEKPGNIGAIIRSADATGVDVIIINDAKTDIYNPNIIRASLGSIFTKQIVVASPEKTIEWLKMNKITSFATTPDAKNEYIDSDFTKPSAFLIGTEHEGLSDLWLSKADEKLRIKMAGKIDSLNASVSAAIVLFEAVRQRRK
ncbi:MAG: RNA methyltransferase [Candidatus Magasanikbacteria bacterium]|nr:RNA methyltransferase [Candidatus Magasanikbacteria bacterium]